MRNLILGLLYLSFCSRNIDAAINPETETYTVEPYKPYTISWEYDNETSMFFVTWTYKNSSAISTTTTVMTQQNGLAAVPTAGFAINHVQNGDITLQNVTDSYSGIYYCIVTYTGMSGLTPVTGTATIELKIATTGDDDNGLPTGAIVGIVIGSVVFVIIIVVVILAIMGKLPGKCDKDDTSQDESSPQNSSNPDKQKTGDYRAGSDFPAIPGADKSKSLAQNPVPLPPIKVKT